ncbi:MAG: hypothetical protein A2Y17_11495 [Clostridiales bacterium GWF2_38_85]|nr:MAG: hypothetical protein A2Y17_11495 [Clostridiales bacterium GWF2_38_85]
MTKSQFICWVYLERECVSYKSINIKNESSNCSYNDESINPSAFCKFEFILVNRYEDCEYKR